MKIRIVTTALVLLALSAPVSAQVSFNQRDCVYDYTMLTDRECRAYRMKVLKARSADERLALQEEVNRLVNERARARGVAENDWRGLTLTPVKSRAR